MYRKFRSNTEWHC